MVLLRELHGKRYTNMAETRKVALFLWVVILLILAEITSVAVAVRLDHTNPTIAESHSPLTSRSKKDMFFTVTTVHPPLPSSEDLLGTPDKLFEEDKRLVHTGPNPLHN